MTISLTGQRGWRTIAGLDFGFTDVFQTFDSHKLASVYNKSAIIRACVNETATTISQAPLQVGRMVDGQFERAEGHEAEKLFYDNPNYSYSQIMELLVQRLELTGASFMFLERFKNRAGVAEIVPVPTHFVIQKTDGPRVTGYKIRTNNADAMPVEMEEMAAVKYLDPTCYQGFSSPLASCIREYQIDVEREEITGELMKNRNMPGMAVKPEGRITADQRSQVKQALEEATGSDASNRGKILVLPSGFEIEQTAPKLDIDFTAVVAMTESRIAACFGVPGIIIGLKSAMDRSTFSNYSEARTGFYREKVAPLWAFIEDTLTRQVLSTMDAEDLVYKFDTSDVAEIQDDLNDNATRAALLFEKGVIDQNEARDMVDLEPVDEMSQPTVTAPSQQEAPAEEKPEGKAEKPLPKANPEFEDPPEVLQFEVVLNDEFDMQKKKPEKTSEQDERHKSPPSEQQLLERLEVY